MPIPFILAGLAAGAGLLGAKGHYDAKKTNEKAQQISEEAEELYSNAKDELEDAKEETKSSLTKMEYKKMEILQSSMKQFMKGFERVKHIEMSDSQGLSELSSFSIDYNGALQIQQMTNIYESSFKAGVGGAAVGVATAAIAGSSIAGVAGLGAIAAPLAAIAAPALLFTGISASIKADENLEKANVMMAEAKAAVEKIKIEITKCNAITERTEMFYNLLISLNTLFAECARYLDSVTRKKKGFFGLRKITPKRLNEQEMKLIAVTRALAGAVKAVIDTPILSPNGDLCYSSMDSYANVSEKLPLLEENSNAVQSYDYKVRLKPALKAKLR